MADSKSLKKIVFTPEACPPLPVFSQAVTANGYVYVSGNIGVKGPEFTLVEGGVQAETRVALENISKVLEAAGTSLENVVKVNIYLANLERDIMPMNETYMEFFGKDAPPPRTCIGVATLPFKANVEFDCVAALPK